MKQKGAALRNSEKCGCHRWVGCGGCGGVGAKTKTVSRRFTNYPRLTPLGIARDISAADLIDQPFLAYTGERLREAAQLISKNMMARLQSKYLKTGTVSNIKSGRKAANRSSAKWG